MAIDYQELEDWFQDRPKWLQDAAHRLVQPEVLSEQDYDELLAICTEEAINKAVEYDGLHAGTLQVQEPIVPLRLQSISDVRGINALQPSRPLIFGTTPLSIVYGRNGAGKSGYVRLLEHACGSRHCRDLLANVFETNVQTQSAIISFEENGQVKTNHWSGNPIPELQAIDIYDTSCGLLYVNEENEVTFEPWILRLFTQLTTVCETIKNRIQENIVSLVSHKPVLPPEFFGTLVGTWYHGITANTVVDDVNEHSTWDNNKEIELQRITARLAEGNAASRAASFRRQRTSLTQLSAELRQIHNSLAEHHCRTYLISKQDANIKRRAAEEDAKKVFENAPLSGIGSDSWRLLWDAARKYSEEVAYPEILFPNVADGSRCVLCQRELDQQSRVRIQSFENFITSQLQQQAEQASLHVQELEESFLQSPSTDLLTTKIDSVGHINDRLRENIITFTTALSTRRQTTLIAANYEEISPLPANDIFDILDTLSIEIENLASASDEDARGQNRPHLESQRRDLSARKWLSQQRTAIDAEINRLIEISRLRLAENLTNTIALSRRKSIIAEELITNAYIQRFKDELRALGADRLLVDIKKTRTEVGRVYHRITLRNATADISTLDVLSEGEFRIVSLVAFLADTEGRGSRTTFIFDDPISSLDHVYEEATAKRLVALTQSRQVIVFTHRLSLVGLLQKYSDKLDVSNTIVCLSHIKTGEIAELPITLTRTKQAVNRLLDERLSIAKRAYQAGDAQYESMAENLCRAMRILLEQVVETDLLNGIIRRYSAEVQTKNKISFLSQITAEDCQFIDDMITSYSRYEHSQPEEAPVQLPTPDIFEQDLLALSGFIDSLQRRRDS